MWYLPMIESVVDIKVEVGSEPERKSLLVFLLSLKKESK